MTNERRALGVNELDVLLNPLSDGATDARDRALILVGFVGGLRRSELVAIDIDDLTKTDRGYKLLVRTSKTDQEGRGRTVILPYSINEALCPVRALDAWVQLAEIEEGAVFRRVRRGDTVTDARLTLSLIHI